MFINFEKFFYRVSVEGVLTLVWLPLLNAVWLFNGFSFPLCAFHVIGRAKLAWRSKDFLADIDPLRVLLSEALNLNGVAETQKQDEYRRWKRKIDQIILNLYLTGSWRKEEIQWYRSCHICYIKSMFIIGWIDIKQ